MRLIGHFLIIGFIAIVLPFQIHIIELFCLEILIFLPFNELYQPLSYSLFYLYLGLWKHLMVFQKLILFLCSKEEVISSLVHILEDLLFPLILFQFVPLNIDFIV